jgi:hypothetical protein
MLRIGHHPILPDSRVAALLAALTAIPVALGSAACGGDDVASVDGAVPAGDAAPFEGGPVDGGTGDRDADTACSETPPIEIGEPITAPAAEWTFIEFPDSRCLNDTATGIGVNLSPESERVMIYLEGGGACFSEATCTLATAHTDGFSERDFRSLVAVAGSAGIFNRDDPANPVADWSFVFIPYCTGDVHAGTNPDGFGGRTQVGFLNMQAYLRRLVPTFSSAELVLLTGSSAGGFGAALNYDQVATAFTSCTPVHLLDDAGPPMSDTYLKPCLQDTWRTLWGLDESLPADCDACRGGDGGGIVNYASYLAEKYPDRRFGLLSSMEDSVIRSFMGYGYSFNCSLPANMPAADFRAGLLELRDDIVGPYDNFRTFYVEGTQHTFLGSAPSSQIAGGVTLSRWIEQLVEGDPTWTDVGP